MQMVMFLLCNAAALCAGWGLARVSLPGGDRLQRVVATASGFLALAIATSIVLGNLGLFAPIPMTLTLALEAAGLHLLAHRRGGSAVAASEPSPPGLPAAIVTGATLGIVVLQCVAFVDAQMLYAWHPQWDDLSYHAPMAAHWLQAERLVLAPYHYHAYYPGNGELFAAWFMLATKLDAYAALAGLFSMALCGLGVLLLCRRLDCDWASSLLAVVVLLMCKPFWQQAGTFAAVDLTATAATAAALALVVPDERDSLPHLRGRALLAGGLLGVAIGCKITCLPPALLIALFLPLAYRPGWRESALVIGLFGLGVLVCGSFYYIRNFVITGNPLFPAAVLGFPGPLDAAARAPTSLLYQLTATTPERLTAGFHELLDWPSPVAWALIAAYALTLLATVRSPSLSQPSGRLRMLLLVVGLCALYVVAAAPFSGTANAKFARLQVRLRFFLPAVLIAIPLAAYWLRRLGRRTPWLPALGLIAACYVSGYPWWRLLSFAAAGAVAGVAFRFVRAGAGARQWLLRVATVAAIVLLPCAAAWATTFKEQQNDLYMQRVIPAWNLLEKAPPGVRVTWFSTFEGYKYYRAFGRGLVYTPIAVGAEGERMPFLHEYWRRDNPTWWVHVDGPPGNVHKLVGNLRKQGIEYVLIMKRHGSDAWGPERDELLHAHGVSAIAKRKSVTLFKIELTHGKKKR